MESSAGVTEKLQHAKAVILHGSVAQIPRESYNRANSCCHCHLLPI